jgi:hypothetical protein
VQLLRLAELSSLQRLALSYSKAQLVLTSAPLWCHLPQLKELRVLTTGNTSTLPTKRQYKAILASIATCKELTKLELAASVQCSARQQQQQQQQPNEWPESDDDDDEAAAAAAEALNPAPQQQQQQQPVQQEKGLAVFSGLAGLTGLRDLGITYKGPMALMLWLDWVT